MTRAVSPARPFGWHLELGNQEYEKTLGCQRSLVAMREQGLARDTIITVEHPSVMTLGSDGHLENYAGLKDPPIRVERGGDITYHGPGQLVVYFIFHLARRGRDLHDFMGKIQDGIITTLQLLQISASRGNEQTGVWVNKKKIASIGIAVRHWVSFHGAAINLSTDLSEFSRINPCGLEASTMTTASELVGEMVDMRAFASQLVENYESLFHTDFYPVSLLELADDMESQSGGGHV